MRLQPYDMYNISQYLMVRLAQVRFLKNWGNESLFQISANSHLVIEKSLFEDNFSCGRGSIIFIEQRLSRVSVSQSIFKKNYALTGGVFFAQLNGFIEVTSSVFTENFALTGGIYYS